MSDDVKHMLGRALGQEPPLRIDRDEVLRAGRKRLRRRRLFASGGVVAAVVVAAVGAVTLPNLVGDSAPERMPPAATSAPTAPPTPETSNQPVPTSSRMAEPLSESWAMKLTAKLHSGGQLPGSAVVPGDDGLPKFQVMGDKYVYQANVVTKNGQGQLQITVEDSRGVRPDCAVVVPTASYNACEIRTKGGVELVVARQWSDKIPTITYVLTVLPDGTLVTASLSIVASNGTSGGTPPDTLFALDDEALCDIVMKSGFRVR